MNKKTDYTILSASERETIRSGLFRVGVEKLGIDSEKLSAFIAFQKEIGEKHKSFEAKKAAIVEKLK